jgi:hypothetical protein
MPSDTALRVSFDMEEISDISLDLLQILQEDGILQAEAALSFALSLGRVISPRPLTQDEQTDFTRACMEWAQMYFHEGTIN